MGVRWLGEGRRVIRSQPSEQRRGNKVQGINGGGKEETKGGICDCGRWCVGCVCVCLGGFRRELFYLFTCSSVSRPHALKHV